MVGALSETTPRLTKGASESNNLCWAGEDTYCEPGESLWEKQSLKSCY